jgi:hypothetical protein
VIVEVNELTISTRKSDGKLWPSFCHLIDIGVSPDKTAHTKTVCMPSFKFVGKENGSMRGPALEMRIKIVMRIKRERNCDRDDQYIIEIASNNKYKEPIEEIRKKFFISNV